MTRVVPDETHPARQCGVYQPLYAYLQNRYATTVVLKLSKIEDILGFALAGRKRPYGSRPQPTHPYKRSSPNAAGNLVTRKCREKD
jgi:hypothetical protein